MLNEKIEIISNEEVENKINILETFCLLRKNIISVFIDNNNLSSIKILIKNGLLSYAEILCNFTYFFFFLLRIINFSCYKLLLIIIL